MNKIWIGVIACVAIAGCHSGAGSGSTAGPGSPTASTKDTYTLSGTISGMDSGTAILHYMRDGMAAQDSTLLTAGHFSFTGHTTSANFASLTLAAIPGAPLSFFLEPGKAVTLEAAAGSLGNGTISGGPVETEYQHFTDTLATFEKRQQLLDSLSEATEGDKPATDSLSKIAAALQSEKQTVIKQYIRTHPASYVSALEMEDIYAVDPDVPQFDSAYGALDTAVRQSPLGKQLAAMLMAAKRTAIGQPAPDFTADDPEGKPVTLSAYARGRIVLVDFWASWCAPCRAENPNVLKAYRQYQSKGFTVLGVSLDDSKEPWIKAIANDQLPWGQVSDLRGWSSGIAAAYGIHAIPMNFLLDRKGRIIAKGLRREELEHQVAACLGSK